MANGGSGVLTIDGALGATVGGTTASDRNVISGNSGDGVEITGSGTEENLVQGNLIGTGATA